MLDLYCGKLSHSLWLTNEMKRLLLYTSKHDRVIGYGSVKAAYKHDSAAMLPFKVPETANFDACNREKTRNQKS